MMPDVDWTDEVPPEVRAALEPLLDHYGKLWPMWMRELRIQYFPDRPQEMSINTNYKYRCATLIPTGIWLTLGQRDREHAVLHEMAHTFWSPVDEVIENLLPGVLDAESPHGKFAKGMFGQNLEAACQDLALTLYRNFGPAKVV